MNRSKVKGMLIGCAVGDSLGMPVETFTPDQIVERYPETKGRVTEYLAPTGHRWFDGEAAGSWTDDTQLTLAIADALIEAEGLDMDVHAKYHTQALKAGPKGWGGSTKRAVRKVANGCSWLHSGEAGTNSGKGNGVAMKISPVAVPFLMGSQDLEYPEFHAEDVRYRKFVRDLSLMTHRTYMGVQSGLVQFTACTLCLMEQPDNCNSVITNFIKFLPHAAREAKQLMIGADTQPLVRNKEPIVCDPKDDLLDRLELLEQYDDFDTTKTIEEFGGGNCYILNSLPFTYMFFLRNPTSIDALYDCISAGGDTDTNGAMIGALLGALHGIDFFPDHLIQGLDKSNHILAKANKLCDTFGID